MKSLAATSIVLAVMTGGQGNALARSAAGVGHPTLRLVHENGYRIAVKGTGWGALSRVTFSVRQGGHVEGLELYTTRAGSFVVGVKNIDPCSGETFVSRDLHRHTVRLQGPGLACPVQSPLPVPRLTVISGAQVNLVMTHMDGLVMHRVVIVMGDAVYVWQRGTKAPQFYASAPYGHFALIGHGRTPPRMCPQAECDSGFYWIWVGVGTGDSGITLSPGCRRANPPCMIPDFLEQVRTVRRG